MDLLKKIIQILKSRSTFFLVTTLIVLSLNLTPLILQYRHSLPTHTFALIHNNVQDFFFYQALMNEGASGAWLTSDPYTTTSHTPSIIFAYFLWLGKLSKLAGISFIIMYHLTRVVFGILVAIAAFRLITYLKLPYPRLAYIFFLFSAPYMTQVPSADKILDLPYMYWWTGMDPIRRFAYLPHHMMGSFILIVNIVTLFQFFKTKKYIWLISSIICAVILSFIHTPSLFILLITLPFSVILYLFSTFILLRGGRSEGLKSKIIPGFLIYFATGVLLMIVMVSQTSKGFPWSQYIEWEKNLQFPLKAELFGALGILFPFALVGAVMTIFSKSFEHIFISSLLFAPILMIPFSQKLNISNIRLVQGTPYLPLSILAIYGVKSIQSFLNNVTMKQLSNGTKRLSKWVPLIVFIVFIINTFPTLRFSLHDQIREYWQYWGNVYLANNLHKAFKFINEHYPPKTTITSTFYVGNYLPAYTHTVSMQGHFGYTDNWQEKEKASDAFFKNSLTPSEAKAFLDKYKIRLVFQGPEEKPLYNGLLYPEIVKPVYDADGITVYEVK